MRDPKTFLRGIIEAEVSRLENQVRFIAEKTEGKIAIGMQLCYYFWCKGSFLQGAHEKILLKETAIRGSSLIGKELWK